MPQSYKEPKVKDILSLLSKGIILSSLFLFPGAAVGVVAISDFYENKNRENDYKYWKSFNKRRLRFLLKRLHDQKMIKVVRDNNESTVYLTKKGRLKALSYKLDEISIRKPKRWDRKWRLILYDISKFKRINQSAFRRMLQKLKMLPLQRSVYLTPYPCDEEIEFLRQYFDVGKEVIYIVANYIENEEVYKEYFGL